tara:strand:+ start:98 stop:826 length:729 start_codon:yes stop_codon:yes gene_type:complete
MNVKRCSGWNGHWACGEDYPDHIAPVSKFGPDTQASDGLQRKCKKCNSFRNSLRPRHPDTGEFKMQWIANRAKEYYGGMPKDRKNDAQWKECNEKAKLDGQSIHWVINNKVVDITPRFKSEYGQSKPMTKRETIHVEGEVVPQGWVYVIRNTETPWLFKIGKTYPDGIQSRLSEARRWGCFKLEEKYWFEDALKAEKEVHALLSEFNMRNLGFEDCGTELFKCWNIGTITDAINKVITTRVA